MKYLIPLLALLVSPLVLSDQTMNTRLCQAMSNHAERQRCLMRYSHEARQQENDSARDNRQQQKRADFFQEQRASLQDFAPAELVGTLLHQATIEFPKVSRVQYVDCRLYNYRNQLLHSARVRIQPPRFVTTLQAPVNTHPYKVVCD